MNQIGVYKDRLKFVLVFRVCKFVGMVVLQRLEFFVIEVYIFDVRIGEIEGGFKGTWSNCRFSYFLYEGGVRVD